MPVRARAGVERIGIPPGRTRIAGMTGDACCAGAARFAGLCGGSHAADARRGMISGGVGMRIGLGIRKALLTTTAVTALAACGAASAMAGDTEAVLSLPAR